MIHKLKYHKLNVLSKKKKKQTKTKEKTQNKVQLKSNT